MFCCEDEEPQLSQHEADNKCCVKSFCCCSNLLERRPSKQWLSKLCPKRHSPTRLTCLQRPNPPPNTLYTLPRTSSVHKQRYQHNQHGQHGHLRQNSGEWLIDTHFRRQEILAREKATAVVDSRRFSRISALSAAPSVSSPMPTPTHASAVT
jgi:hypothetical protein